MKVELSTDQKEQTIFHGVDSATIVRYSPFDGKFYKATINLLEYDYHRWRYDGLAIQDALPYLTNEEREFLISGYTPEQWKIIFPPEKDEQNDKN
jgi:hypothetical protein